MASFSFQGVFNDNERYSIPARIVNKSISNYNTNEIAYHVELFLDVNEDIAQYRRSDNYLFTSKKSLNEGAEVTVTIKGEQLNGNLTSKFVYLEKAVNQNDYLSLLTDYKKKQEEYKKERVLIEHHMNNQESIQYYIENKKDIDVQLEKIKEYQSEISFLLENNNNQRLDFLIENKEIFKKFSSNDFYEKFQFFLKKEKSFLSFQKNKTLFNEYQKKEKQVDFYKDNKDTIDAINSNEHLKKALSIINPVTNKPKKEELNKEVYTNALKELENLGIQKSFAHCYLLSLMTALVNGRFLLLTGNVGTGKSYLVKNTGKLFNGESNLVAVRPAWLDASDLLGYYDPINQCYQQTDFVSHIRKPDNNRINIVLLDEMNIARIENYAADILANLSPIHDRGSEACTLQLMDDSLKEKIRAALLLDSDSVEILEDKDRQQLENIVQDKVETSLILQKNLLLCGTLNIDGSTENLSPKMIDRSFMLKFPDYDGAYRPQHEIKGFDFSINGLEKIVQKSKDEYINKWETFYKKEEIQKVLPLLNPLSNRVAEDFITFSQLANHFMGKNDEEIEGYFIFSRLLPRLNYIKSADIQDIAAKLFEKCKDMPIAQMQQKIEKAPDGSLIFYQAFCG